MRLFSWLREHAGTNNATRIARQRRAKNSPARFRPRLEALEDRQMLSGGALDPTFGTGGRVTTSAGVNIVQAFAVATYPQAGTANDGKIMVGGLDLLHSGNQEFAVVRLNLDGSLDKSFGGTGEVSGPSVRVRAVAVEPDGKVLAAGTSGNHFAIARFNTDGSRDSSFGSRGVATTSITSKGVDEIFAIGLQADGKIVVAGSTSPANSSTRDLVVARYNANGSLDSSFGTGGKALDQLATSPRAGGGTYGMGLAIDNATGAIVVQAADPSNRLMVVRYTSGGQLDSTFAGTGHETLPTLYSSSAVGIQPADHRIVVAGSAGGVQAVARLNSDGSLDNSFGANGIETTSVLTLGVTDSLKLQTDGQILVGMSGRGDAGFVVARFNASNGALDTSFGNGGVANAAFPSGAYCVGLALEPDGRIVAAGYTASGTVEWAVARFLASGPQIGSFSVSPNSLAAGGMTTLTASNITDGNPNAAITQVAFYYLDGNGNQQTLGYGTQTSAGVWTLNYTVGLPTGTYTIYAQAKDSYGALGDPLTQSLQVL